jgi:chaperonin GroEL (HSP60 family)
MIQDKVAIPSRLLGRAIEEPLRQIEENAGQDAASVAGVMLPGP